MVSERVRRYQRRWRRANKARVAEYNRRRRECRRKYKQRLRAENPGLSTKLLNEWFERNPGKRNEYRAAYNARRKKLSVALTAIERKRVAEIYAAARMLTRSTGIRHHVDHKKPLAKGGLHHPDNLQVLTAVLNQRKGAK